MLKFRLYDKKLDIDLDEWSNKDYSDYQNDVHKFALFNETISQIYNSYIENPDQMGSIFDRVIVVEEDSLKVAVIVVNYYIDEKDNKKALGMNPILVNPKLIDKGYGKRIIKYLIDIKGRIFDMLPTKIYAGIDVNNIRCKHLFEKLGFELVGQTDDNDFLYYELEIKQCNG